MKKLCSVFCAAAAAVLLAAGCGSADNGLQADAASAKEITDVQSPRDGVSCDITIENAFYYDLMADDTGDIFALTDNAHESSSENSRVIAWQSSDQGGTWKELLYQPEELSNESELIAGVLRNGTECIEAFAVFAEYQDEADKEVYRLYRVTETACEELEASNMLEQLGGTVWNISLVNDHVISLAGGEQCILYDTEKQESVKSLSYDSYTVGFLSMQDQFLVYGNEIAYCLDAKTLEEQDAEESLQQFISTMYEKNNSAVFPPMKGYQDSIICATTEAVYEYKNGKTIQTLSIPATVNGGNCFNGIFPICKGNDAAYYIGATKLGETTLQRLEADEGTNKDVLTVYSLIKNEDISQTAMLFQQAHPELKVELQAGIEDEASLTRTDAIKQLNTELLAGGGPDILIMDGLSVEKYADTGLLLPIESRWLEDKYFKNILETYQKEGVLYAVPAGFGLYAVQGPAGMASEITSLSDMCQWILSNTDKEGLDEYQYTYKFDVYCQYAQFIYDAYAGSIVQNGTAVRDSLEEYLNICGQLAEKSGSGFSDGDYTTYSILAGAVEIFYNEAVKISAGTVSNVTDIAALSTEQNSQKAEYSLCPTDSAMYQPRDIIAINANTDHADIAQDFVDFSLEDASQKTNIQNLLPVSREIFRNAIEGEGSGADSDGLFMDISVSKDEESFLLYCPSRDEVNSLEQKIEGLDNVFEDDVIVREIVMEAAESYLAGAVSLEDAVSSAENKINLYLRE